MSIDFPKDPAIAAAILASLATKDEAQCRYPLCEELRQDAAGPGKPPMYCERHTALSAHRARAQLKAIAAQSLPSVASGNSAQITASETSLMQDSVLSTMRRLHDDMEHYMEALVSLVDPGFIASQIQAAQDEATARIAEAEARVNTERSQRLAAETKATLAAEEARAGQEAAEEALARMEETEAALEALKVETEQRLSELMTLQDEAIERIQGQAEAKTKEVEAEARAAIEEAKIETAQAVTRAEEAREEASKATSAQAQAERLAAEVREALGRERAEVERLRKEINEAKEEARLRAEADRAFHREAMGHERAEIDRLRKELGEARAEVSQTIARTEELRDQLLQERLRGESDKPA